VAYFFQHFAQKVAAPLFGSCYWWPIVGAFDIDDTATTRTAAAPGNHNRLIVAKRDLLISIVFDHQKEGN
jgi:hypothetical protein